MLLQRLVMVSLILCALAVSAGQAPANNCAAAQQRQFDFWVGDWKLTWPGDKPGETVKGSNRIVRILDGCVVQENFDGGTGMHLRGTSVSSFDARSGKWKQTWVDNEGGYLDFVGEFRDGHMVLSRQGLSSDGARILQRMIWKNIGRNELDWSWEASEDGGKTWQVRWPIHYTRAE